MKDIIVTNCEKSYVEKCIDEYRRVDGRAFDEFRPLKVEFGHDWGCVHVALGETRILAQVSCEIQQPKATRSQEGILNINVELSPMGAPNFEAGRQSELSVHLNRMLEKCIKDSKAVDLESLCIKVNEKVWALRVDLNILNHEGNLLDCASIAALTALAHFKRPDVTSDGEKIIIHTYEQRDPIPTTVHHYPVCISYAIFKEGDVLIADPTLLEEGVSEAQLLFAINAFKEICSLHLGGSALANPNLIITGAMKAASRAFIVVQIIREALEKDAENRKQNIIPVFEDFICPPKDRSLSHATLGACLNKWTVKGKSRKQIRQANRERMEQEVSENVEKMDEDLCENGPKLEETPIEIKHTIYVEASSDDESDIQIMDNMPQQIEKIEIIDSDGSEEDAVVILNPEEKSPNKRNRKRNTKN